MKIIIDRFEGNYAVCESGYREMVNIERKRIPSDAKEGDVLLITDDHITVDHEATEERKKKIAKLTKGLWK